MIRCFALAVSLILAGAVSASAQTHPPSHPQDPPHGPTGHVPMDPAQHAALHALMHGDWHGTLSTPEGSSRTLDLTVSTDKLGHDVFQITGEPAARVGHASQIAIEGHQVRWMQDISGMPCKAVADVVAATSRNPETLKGTMTCAQSEMTFALHKTKK